MIYTICHFVLACKRAPSMWVCEKLLHICQELRRYQNLRWRDYASVNSSWMRKFFLLLANAVKSSYDQGEHCLSALFFTFLTCWYVQFLNISAFLFSTNWLLRVGKVGLGRVHKKLLNILESIFSVIFVELMRGLLFDSNAWCQQIPVNSHHLFR